MQLNDIPFDDKKTFDMLSKGLNVGVFQLNEGWVRGILRDVKPNCFEDIVALVSLVRPGSLDSGGPKEYAARKRSGQTAPNVHPELDEALTPILANTYGLILYQEQVMEIAQKLAGYSLGEADMLRRAMGKKKPEVLAAEYPKFSEGMWKHGDFSTSATETLWTLLLPFADYAFNRSHAVGYALISYWTAYLKANYPAEFIAALMTGDAEDQAKIKEYINEAKRLGIDVLPPSINESDLGFTPTKEGIRFGLAAIKGIGPSVIQGILDQRPYASFDRFIWEAHPTVRNSRVLKALTESGSLDSLWTERLQVLREIERLSGLARDHRAKHERGERTLFRIEYTPKARTTSDLFAGSKRERIKQGELDTIGIQLTFPSIVLKADKELSASEIAFVKTVLESRVPESNVYVQTGSFRVKLGLRSSFKGLSSALSKIGVEVYEV